MRVVVTGATGFVGRHLCSRLKNDAVETLALSRRERADLDVPLREFDISVAHDSGDWHRVLADADAVVHLAGLAHSGIGRSDRARRAYYRINVDASVRLMEASMEFGVGKFIFLSSVKAAGETSRAAPDGRPIPLSTADRAAPEDIYGESKLAAENELKVLSSEHEIELTILRPPLVYGVGQKSNMAKLFRLVRRGVPLPFAAIDNRRSLISVNNLCDAIVTILDFGGPGSGTFMLSDVEVSTPGLVRAIAASMQRPARLFALPSGLLRGLATIAGQRAAAERLLGSLVVEREPFCRHFEWRPSIAFEDVLTQIARADHT